jgi:multidrug efflux system outer membrane protein
MDTIAVLPAGTSSEVLLRRPDVVEAEYRLRAANADIGVARAALFPRISLTGLLGVASDALGSLFTGDAFSATATGAVSAPIFDFGGRLANVRVNEAQRDAALAAYERAIQTAFREVADALAVQGTITERVRAAHANTEAAADSARLAEARYAGGIDSFLANLVAQRSLYTARSRETATLLQAIRNRATLYRVLAADTALATPQP